MTERIKSLLDRTFDKEQKKFRRDVDTGVAVVSGTTLLSILTMPAVVALAMSLF